MVFRFEAYENVISKHNIKSTDWRQAARWAFGDKLNTSGWTICSVKQLDDDTVEIIKRNDHPSRSWFYTWGFDNTNLYQRVILNRSDCSVAVDRLDSNYNIEGPFLGQRDLFYVEKADMTKMKAGEVRYPNLSFIRHNFWMSKFDAPWAKFSSNFSAMSYGSAFGKEKI